MSAALAAYKKKVLAIDMDRGMRNLDLLLGMSRMPVDCSIEEAISGMCSEEDSVVVSHPYIDTLFYATANHNPLDTIDKKAVADLINFFSTKFDFIIIDSAPGIGEGFRLSVESANECIVVVNPDIASLRDADSALTEASTVNSRATAHILINRYNSRMIRNKNYFTKEQVEKLLSVRPSDIIGVWPDDKQFILSENAQRLYIAMFPKTDATAAIFGTAKELTGESVHTVNRTTADKKRFNLFSFLKKK